MPASFSFGPISDHPPTEFPKQRRRRHLREKVDAARHAEFRKVQEAVRRGDLANELDPEVALAEDVDAPVESDDADEPQL